MTYLAMADAAYAQNIPPGFQVAAGYIGGSYAYHVWSREDWDRFPGLRLPVWVAAPGASGQAEGELAVGVLHALGVPEGAPVALDMETRDDAAYVDAFGGELHRAGYYGWVYGSADFLFRNPGLDGWWVADYTGQPHMYDHPRTRATQWAADLVPGYDASDVRRWVAAGMWHG